MFPNIITLWFFPLSSIGDGGTSVVFQKTPLPKPSTIIFVHLTAQKRQSEKSKKWPKKWLKMAQKRQSEKSKKWPKKWLKMAQKRQSEKSKNGLKNGSKWPENGNPKNKKNGPKTAI